VIPSTWKSFSFVSFFFFFAEGVLEEQYIRTSYMSSGNAIARQLLRVSRRIHLPGLKQGTTLSVRTKLPRAQVSLRIQSGWRDDGGVTLVQSLPRSCTTTGHDDNYDDDDDAVELRIQQEENQVTSLGRSESHLSIELQRTSRKQVVVPLELPHFHDEPNPAILVQDQETEVKAWWVTSSTKDADQSEPDMDDIQLILDVPEKVNLICELLRGSIDVTNKIEGDVKLQTSNGSIRVKKLRGHTVELETSSADSCIHASDLLEAQQLKLNLLQGGRLRAKRIHGDTVDIKVTADAAAGVQEDTVALDDDDQGALVDISSMFVSGTGGAHVTLEQGLVRPNQRGVRIKSHHGPVVVHASSVHGGNETQQPLVELGSVNGSCEVFIDQQLPPDTKQEQRHPLDRDWTSCQVHYDSISPESVSLIHTNAGNIVLTFDRKMEADLRLLSSTLEESLTQTVDVLAEEDDPKEVIRAIAACASDKQSAKDVDPTRISIKTPSFTMSQSYVSSDDKTEYVDGWVENKSHEPDSRFEMKTRGDLGLGKIRLDGAANQALKNFSPSPTDHNADASGAKGGLARPLIVAATSGSISVETLSWLGSIARRYGLDEKGRDLGRQATRRGRVILPADE
jgi:hypothetical protein